MLVVSFHYRPGGFSLGGLKAKKALLMLDKSIPFYRGGGYMGAAIALKAGAIAIAQLDAIIAASILSLVRKGFIIATFVHAIRYSEEAFSKRDVLRNITLVPVVKVNGSYGLQIYYYFIATQLSGKSNQEYLFEKINQMSVVLYPFHLSYLKQNT